MSENIKSDNPLLARLRMPGATFKLPSQGIFYTNGELDETVKNGEVEVYPMVAIDEIVMSTPDKLISGKAIQEVFMRCIPQIKKPAELLAKDVDFLMVALRSVSFGDTLEVSYQHDCENAKMHTYNVNLSQMIRATKAVDPTLIATEYAHTMPNGQQLLLKPLTYGDIVELYQMAAMTKSNDLSEEDAQALIVNTLAGVIKSVDGIDERELIRQWVAQLPLGWKRQLEATAQSVTQWGVDFTSKQKCKDCKQHMEVQVTANPVSFFT